MSLPPGFLEELKDRVSLADVAGRKVTWDSRKSNPGKGDFWAPCPFHQEKTASFHVDDRKGFYYCFGCHEKGDTLKFVRETENVGFMDAVRLLADQVGMPVPAQDPRAQQKERKRAGLVEVMEMAVQFYRLQLNTAAAANARDYITGRGLSPQTVERFEIGFAPNNRTGLAAHLKGKGIPEAQMIEAGLVIKPDDGGAPFDRFRDRIMFPIRDARGRAIAFGGRAMSETAKAKYLNSNDTPLFDKGRTLYNHAPARQAAGKTGALIVAEGYMDVIALASHGFDHTVAPLGTAITERQLQLMWRIADEPIIALDGDKAGLRAAMRLIDTALPLLEAGKSLRFAILPEGQDPDDLLRNSGTAAMQKLLDGARPMIDLLWQRETEGRVLDSPERRAALDAQLRQAIAKITDPGIRAHYGAEIRDRRATLFAPARRTNTRTAPWTGKAKPPARPTSGAANSALARGASDAAVDARLREAAILAACLSHPQVILSIEDALENLPLGCSAHVRLRDAALHAAHQAEESGFDPEQFDLLLDQAVGRALRDEVSALAKTRAAPHMKPDADLSRTERSLRADIARHRAILGHRDEVTEALQELSGEADEGVTWRLAQAAAAEENAARDATAGEDNDQEERTAMSDYLQRLIDEESWKKPKR